MLFDHEAWVLFFALFALYSPLAALPSYLPVIRGFSHRRLVRLSLGLWFNAAAYVILAIWAGEPLLELLGLSPRLSTAPSPASPSTSPGASGPASPSGERRVVDRARASMGAHPLGCEALSRHLTNSSLGTYPPAACRNHGRDLCRRKRPSHGLAGWTSQGLDRESQLSEYPDGAGLPALKITGGKALARGELISCAQNCLVRVMAFVPDQLITPALAEAMLREELFRAQAVVLLYRAQHVITGHVIPRHHLSTIFLR